MLKHSPKILALTKRHFLQLKLSDINRKAREECCGAGLRSVWDPLTP